MNAFNLSFTLAQTIAHYAQAIAIDQTGMGSLMLAKLAIDRMATRLQADSTFCVHHMVSALSQTPASSIAFQVASGPVSFHNTLNWLAGNAIFELYRILHQKNDFTVWEDLFDTAVSQIPVEFMMDHRTFGAMIAMEMPLRVIVLLAQVRAGLWVRNGYAIRNQVWFHFMYSFTISLPPSCIVSGLQLSWSGSA